MHFNLSFKSGSRAVPLLRAFRLPASERRRKTGGDKEEVGWCETDQTMDVRKSIAVPNQLQAKKKEKKEWRRSGGVR